MQREKGVPELYNFGDRLCPSCTHAHKLNYPLSACVYTFFLSATIICCMCATCMGLAAGHDESYNTDRYRYVHCQSGI